MNEASLLDIISPIMVGPSSSHTAGAVKLGLLARNIYSNPIEQVKIILYNSYAQTGIGHGTDKGLLSGLVGFEVDDVIIKDIFNSVEASKVEYRFEYLESFSRHPNAVDFIFKGKNEMKISGKSVGGGEIVVDKIDDFDVNLDGKLNTILVISNDELGMLSKITNVIQEHKISIADLTCSRKGKGQLASCAISLDDEADNVILEKIDKLVKPNIIRYIKKLQK